MSYKFFDTLKTTQTATQVNKYLYKYVHPLNIYQYNLSIKQKYKKHLRRTFEQPASLNVPNKPIRENVVNITSGKNVIIA